jgi:magnesium-transporting ATPase (P-type)
MIQRQQTLWLLLATAAGIFTFILPFGTGTEKVANSVMERAVEIIAGSNFFILLLSIACIGVSGFTIFLFKHRNQQYWLCILGILLTLGLLTVYIIEMRKLIKPVPALSSVLPVIMLVSFFMAFRGVRKDEKLVKSLDKLR